MKRTISVLAVLLCMVLFRFIPAPAGLTASAMQVLGIFTGALILWMTISIDWPSMLVLAALVTCIGDVPLKGKILFHRL